MVWEGRCQPQGPSLEGHLRMKRHLHSHLAFVSVDERIRPRGFLLCAFDEVSKKGINTFILFLNRVLSGLSRAICYLVLSNLIINHPAIQLPLTFPFLCLTLGYFPGG